MSGPPDDVVVVGAGPAGSLAAWRLARAGLRVRLLDRARFPRPKLCGDTLNPGALALLEGTFADGGAPRAMPRIRAGGAPLDGMTLSGPPGIPVTSVYPRALHGLAIPRQELDRILVETAIEAGVTFSDGRPVAAPVVEGGRVTGVQMGDRAGTPVRARIVLAADGRASRLAAVLGLARLAPHPRRWAFGAYYEGVQDVGSCGEMHLRPDGYIGIAPLGGGRTNVCVVRHRDAGRGARTIDQATVIERTLAADRMLAPRFRGARRLTPVTALGPLAVTSRASGRPGLLLAGDAAGFVDPMTGDGLRFALQGGLLAAEAALRELATGRPAHVSLDAARRQAFGVKWRINTTLRGLAGSPRALTVVSRLAEWWPAPAGYLVAIAGDVHLAGAPGGGHLAPSARQVGPTAPAHRLPKGTLRPRRP